MNQPVRSMSRRQLKARQIRERLMFALMRHNNRGKGAFSGEVKKFDKEM